jgi:hypothetical protein
VTGGSAKVLCVSYSRSTHLLAPPRMCGEGSPLAGPGLCACSQDQLTLSGELGSGLIEVVGLGSGVPGPVQTVSVTCSGTPCI